MVYKFTMDTLCSYMTSFWILFYLLPAQQKTTQSSITETATGTPTPVPIITPHADTGITTPASVTTTPSMTNLSNSDSADLTFGLANSIRLVFVIVLPATALILWVCNACFSLPHQSVSAGSS
ncbi:hypothetical protein MATL_G00173060 [Megalops atlanticus]|uniref:Uncharacterized protein n=1 Tax=Megalops atlanticus TaxID=7932 RepID=A0A9D3T8A9_MEGAT|nr:hypothetical protein MATL_G00173060 [Megalops atlanticus]